MSSAHKILLVDDNPADANLTCEVLATSERPAQVSTVVDGEQALQFLHRSGQFAEASRPDLIILDLNLPRKDGRAVLAEVKADPELNDLPVVIFTTSHAPRDIARCYELGANSFITKPVRYELLVEVMRILSLYWLKTVELPALTKATCA